MVVTCRKCLTRLNKKGKIKKHSYGFYVPLSGNVTLNSSMVSAVGGLPPEPRLHCLRLKVSDVVGKAGSWRRDVDFVRVTFQRYANGKAQIFVHCRKGYSLDYVAFRLLVDKVLREIGQADCRKVSVTNFEFNHDYLGLKLDGVRAVTLTTLDGSFRRVYSKRLGLRDEVKTVGSVSVNKVFHLLEGGHIYNATQLLLSAVVELRQSNIIISDVAKSTHRLVDWLLRQNKRWGQDTR
jgi:hypothetical protein